ncbi:unnamed protein product (macronuclear) [Paramecium tetraurelia]|uniref:Tetraspanin family protein n=1 Tax=Paramecium tetraurelia TaxID=5888 RepID=A0E8Y0_PARTE|nr:uncharacterized protein GSPATT00024478001 [Paramecium tetraurelia]CAK91747.1 unnamed protein product [Paramecium tetraurelia]|eukprot:XP_001459144.1 hypothetical protein (macronuclear) [Paramecium tetraurelia strain d4-2]
MQLFSWLSQKIVQLSAITLISIGLTLTGYGIYIVSLILFKNYDGYFKFDSDFGMFGQKYGALVIGLSLIIFGIFGILGSTAKKVCFRRGFLILHHLSVLLFGILFVVLFYLLNFKAKEYFGRSCESTQNFKALSDGVKSANESFCSIKCPCNLDATKFNDKSVLRGKVGFSSSVLPSNVQSCVGFDTEEYKYPVQLMNILEMNFSCSGWCTSTSIFVFSDINRGNTSGQSCFLKFQSYYEDYVTIMGYISLCLGILFMLSFSFIFCLYCGRHDLEKQRAQELRLLCK